MNLQPPPSVDYVFYAKVIRVVDGDTIDVEIDHGCRIKSTQRLRFADINTPEDTAGKPATNYVIQAVAGAKLVIRTYKSDAFDRWLTRVWVNGVDLNATLVNLGFAVPFREGSAGV